MNNITSSTSSTSSIYYDANQIRARPNHCNENEISTNENLIKLKVIFNDDDREVPYKIIKKENDKYNHSLAVAQVILYDNKGHRTGAGTAWRLGPGNLMMTNSHVMSKENIDGAKIRFTGGEYSCKGNSYGCSYKYDDELFVKAENIIHSSPLGDISFLPDENNLDYSLFTVDDKVFKTGSMDKYGYLEIDHEGGFVGEEVYIPQHGYSDKHGTEKTISYQEIHPIIDDDLNKIGSVITKGKVTEVNTVILEHNLDITKGSSGSPVISSEENKVIAINARSGNNKNVAINMKYIWPQIKDYYYDSLKEKNNSINVSA